MDAERKIAQARVAMLFDHPFFGYLATGMPLRETPDMKPPTMGTDGRVLYYHPDFVENCSLPELQGTIAHELAHCFLNHIPRRHNRNPKRWNVACDYAVNDLITKQVTDKNGATYPEFVLPQGSLWSSEWADKHVEYIYNHLPSDNSDEPGDSHEQWENWGQGEDGNGDGDVNNGGADLEQQWREATAQAANAARMRGKLPGHIEEAVGGVLQPKLDWKTILREMITSCAKSDFTIFPCNKKHIYRGFVLPGITGEEINICVVIDTSGSVSNDEMKEFLSEVRGICDSYSDYTIHLITCDAQIHQQLEITPMDELPTVLQGRGGTDFHPPFEAANKLDGITALVYLTDLMGPFPDKEPEYATIWVATEELPVPFGTRILYPRMKD